MQDSTTVEDHEIIEKFRVFKPNSDTICTEAFSKFLTDFRSHSDLFFFIVHVVGRADETRRVAAKALASAGGSELDRERGNYILEKAGGLNRLRARYGLALQRWGKSAKPSCFA